MNPANYWITLKLAGVRSNHSALGAKVRLTAGPRTQYDEVRSGGGSVSQSDLRLHFGIGSARRADRIEVLWPPDRVVLIEEPRP